MKVCNVPTGWEIQSIGVLTTNHDNRRIPLNRAERSEKEGIGLYPYVGANNILTYIDEYIFDEKILCIAEDGGSWGYKQTCSFIMNERCWVNNHAHVVTVKDNLIIEYLKYYLNYADLNLYINGATRGKLNQSVLNKIKIPLPPLAEQQKIAEILDAADALRHKDQQLIDHYTTLGQSLFLEMFGDPVTNPMGWETINLNEICSFNKVSISPAEIVNGTKYLALECIQKKTGCIHSYQIVADGELKSNKFFFDEETILYGKLRPYLNKVALPTFKGICSTEIIPLKPIKNLTNKYFIAQVMRGKGFVLFADENSSGANLPRISPKKIEKYKIINPPITLQNQFSNHMASIEKQKQQAQASLAQSNNLFNSLLQKAFTGELTA